MPMGRRSGVMRQDAPKSAMKELTKNAEYLKMNRIAADSATLSVIHNRRLRFFFVCTILRAQRNATAVEPTMASTQTGSPQA